MSFAGHVFDMIRRDKENRELRKRFREKNKDKLQKFTENDSSLSLPDVSLEEYEAFNHQLKENEKIRQQNTWRLTWIVILSILVLTALLLILFKFAL